MIGYRNISYTYSYTEDNLIKLINQTCLISKQEKMHFEKKKNERWIFYKFFESEKRNSAQKFTGSFFLKHETQVDWASKIIVLTIPTFLLPVCVNSEHSLKIIDMVEYVVDTFAKKGHGIKRHRNSNETTRLSRASAIKIRFPRQPRPTAAQSGSGIVSEWEELDRRRFWNGEQIASKFQHREREKERKRERERF